MEFPRHGWPAELIATFFLVGRLPRAPGTFGSLAALPILYLLHVHWGAIAVGLFAGTVAILGTWATAAYLRGTEESDPGSIVIDEVLGQAIAVLVLSAAPLPYLFGFVLFRIFDIVKPWPANIIDARMKSAAGVMLDDVVAGIYAGVATLLIIEVLP